MSRPPGEAQGFGKVIQSTRLERGWSQTDLANKSGLSRPTISRVELGEASSTQTLRSLAEALGLVLDVHVGDE